MRVGIGAKINANRVTATLITNVAIAYTLGSDKKAGSFLVEESGFFEQWHASEVALIFFLPYDVKMISSYVRKKEYLKFELLSRFKNLGHAFLTKTCGNVSLYSNEDPLIVNTRLQEISKDLGIKNIVDTIQVHGIRIKQPDEEGEADGFYTNQKNIPLMIRTADCQAALFYEPEKQVLAVVHAGWRGLDQKIYSHTIRHLKEKYLVSPDKLMVGISPSIGHESFEFKEKPPLSISRFLSGPDKYDLKRVAEEELLEAGVLKQHIEIAPECTYLDEERFFSYRRNKTTHRQALLAWLI